MQSLSDCSTAEFTGQQKCSLRWSLRLLLLLRSLQVKRQQPLQYLLVAEVMQPAVGIEDSNVQFLV